MAGHHEQRAQWRVGDRGHGHGPRWQHQVIGNALDTVDLGGHMVIDPGFGDQGPCVAVLDPNGVWTDAALISGQVGPIMDVPCSPVD